MSKVSEMLSGLAEAAAGKVSLHLREGADVSGYSVASCAPGHRECHCLFLETVAFVHQLPHPAPEGADKQSQFLCKAPLFLLLLAFLPFSDLDKDN